MTFQPMRELEVLFGFSFPIESVVDFRVRRARAGDLAMQAMLGSAPAWLSLVLADGRRFEANSRGAGPERDAIEVVARRVAEWKAGEALRALDSGNAAAFGPVAVTPVGIQHGNQLTRWEDVGGFAVRHGGLLWDDAKGRLSGEVMLADVPFSDALCAVVATRLAGRDYDSMGSAQGPRHGLFSVTARTRIPGTFKYQRHLFLGSCRRFSSCSASSTLSTSRGTGSPIGRTTGRRRHRRCRATSHGSMTLPVP